MAARARTRAEPSRSPTLWGNTTARQGCVRRSVPYPRAVKIFAQVPLRDLVRVDLRGPERVATTALSRQQREHLLFATELCRRVHLGTYLRAHFCLLLVWGTPAAQICYEMLDHPWERSFGV